MAYTNSPLVNYTKLSPNHSGTRTHSIDRISPHCVVGQVTVERLGEIFASRSRGASCNYGIDKNGKVVLIVEEKNRSWCTSSNANDQRAITIEIASDTSHPYAMNTVAYNKFIDLCVDICKRNGKTKLLWFNNKNTSLNYIPKQNEMILTVHRWFAAKSCPGDWLYNRLGDVAKEVTKRLGSSSTVSTKSSSIDTLVKKGVINTPDYWLSAKDDLKYLDILLDKLANACQSKAVSSIDNVDEAINHLVKCKIIDSPNYWVDNYGKVKYLDSLLIKAAKQISIFAPYKVRVTDDALNIRKGAGTNYDVRGVIRDKGVYTIVEEATGKGASKWGLLKSYSSNKDGWISLDFCKKI